MYTAPLLLFVKTVLILPRQGNKLSVLKNYEYIIQPIFVQSNLHASKMIVYQICKECFYKKTFFICANLLEVCVFRKINIHDYRVFTTCWFAQNCVTVWLSYVPTDNLSVISNTRLVKRGQ